MKCSYGDGEACFVAHDRRGCEPVCPVHAFWRRFWCSRIGNGHGAGCELANVDAHITTDSGGSADDALLDYELPAGWKSVSGCGDLLTKGKT